MADKFLSTMRRIPHWVIVLVLLALGAVLAITSLVGDSITFDETSHLTAGYSYLKTGDFRLGPENPPLFKIWAALPLLLVETKWIPPETQGWREGDHLTVGRKWLFDLNDGERLLLISRCMMVVLLLIMCLCVYIIGRKLFGRQAGLLALTLATFSPTFLAHGRLVKNDMPMTLGVLITLLTFARLFERITLGRVLVAAAALSALSLVKFSWLAVLPALAIMVVIAVFRRQPIPYSFFWRKQTDFGVRLLVGRFSRACVMLFVGVFVVVIVWLSIWTCFRWRYSPFVGDDNSEVRMATPMSPDGPAPSNMDDAWKISLTDPDGKPMRGVIVGFVRIARKYRLLPESYIYGLAYTLRATMHHISYLLGKNLQNTSAWYFPIAFAIKTPLAVMVLLAGGLICIYSRRVSINPKNYLLLAGLAGFVVVYAFLALTSKHNIGHRHLLPLYPAIMVFGGASVVWLSSRVGRWFVLAAVLWLVAANLWIHPHYLAYFNELVGGPSRGYLYLADSNIDWGQDIKRLAKYAKEHPHETIKLSYFGSGVPSKYGFECEQLRSVGSLEDFGKPAELSAGTYVVSINQLLGIYDMFIDNEFWQNRRNVEVYKRMHNILSVPLSKDATEQERLEREKLAERYYQVQQARLINRLRYRAPDERIGYSLFVYRLSQKDVDLLLQP